MIQPIRTVYNKRLAYLVSLDSIYREQGYKTKLDGFNSVLEVYAKDANMEELTNGTTETLRIY